MPHLTISRRAFTALLTGCALAGCSSGGSGPASGGSTRDAVGRAYTFLDRRVDEAAGTPGGLPRSYTGGYMARHHSTVAFTYDVALVIIAYCMRGRDADLDRAAALSRTLVALQEQDAEDDGRLRQSYASGRPSAGARVPEAAADDVFTGTLAWAGLALLHAHKATDTAAFRSGALRAAQWIQDTTFRSSGTAGYAGGLTAAGKKVAWRSSEHNADVAGFFRALGSAVDDDAWGGRADTAVAFLDAMWDADRGAFWTGTGTDGSTVNRSPVPEDPQTWSYLATRDNRHATSLDWALRHLAAKDNGFVGVSVSDADTSKVWFEGTGHLVCALRARNGGGDAARADRLLASLRRAQSDAPGADGYGLVAASSDGLDTGDGDRLYASLHTGTTAWFALAGQRANPFVLG
ncbi:MULTISPECIES: hypothetical protein [unclassified Streptomyces]|uniref:hypothetical protein n=1 Tax=unclassified Streptomyces TaxID=2593676 RepID=UPI000DBAC2AF|nr:MULTISPECIES: hypothetical protein [unclassified Streptomyces]MYT75544.1 hypothetical protein [Streptomyces sp. SID8367]RAJ86950.1 hypothetical protein K377_02631 [Streptomyces sp. PsTaAH-137]